MGNSTSIEELSPGNNDFAPSKGSTLPHSTNGDHISSARADEIWSPFVECGRVEPFEGAKSLFPGESSSIDVEFPIPRRVEPSDNPELLHDELIMKKFRIV